ncbi:MAG: hypothetical protein ACF8K1_07050 [Phycisphaerales bacterium JB047]
MLDDVLRMKRYRTLACQTALLLIPVSMVGCQPAQAVVDAQGLVPADAAEPVELRTDDSSVWESVFAELMPQAVSSRENTPSHGPSLVAGDWLAFQCAIAGGYLGTEHEKGTPAYAEVPESWFRFE